jgi:hypothetical protein
VNPDGFLHSIFKGLLNFPHVLITTRPIDFKFGIRLEILGFDSKGVDKYVENFFSKEQQPTSSTLGTTLSLSEMKSQASLHSSTTQLPIVVPLTAGFASTAKVLKPEEKEVRRHLHQPLVRSLGRVPINLEIFCSLAASGKSLFGSKVPTMTALYIQLTDWLFKRFRIERELENPGIVIAESDARYADNVDPLGIGLEKIAWEAMEKNTLYLPERRITAIFRSLGIKSGSITRVGPLCIEQEEGVFIHLTFQEFLLLLV